ncbi:hypothetical protein ABPG73_002925 [Tetrahymena malaccensis]
MTKNLFFIFSYILIQIGHVLNSCPQIKPILTNLEYFSCELMQAQQQEKGKTILQDQKQDHYSITFVGWYRFIGKSNQDYLFIQARNGATQNLIKLVYNPVKMQIECTILNDVSTQDISIQLKTYLQDKWFFLRVGINLQDQQGLSYIYYTIIYEQNSFITQSKSQKPDFIVFDNQNFEYFYGSTSYYPYSRSCAASKQVLAFLGQANYSSEGSLKGISQFEMFLLPKLIFHLNLFMASSSYQIYNLNEEFKFCQETKFFKSPYFSFKTNQAVNFINILNFQESEGFVITLDINVSLIDANQYDPIMSLTSTNYNQIYQYEKYNEIYQLCIDSNSKIYDQFYSENQISILVSPRYHFQQDIWHKIVIFIQLKFNLITRLLYVDGTLIDKFTLNNNFKYSQINLLILNMSLNLSSSRQVDYRNIKVYQGGFIYQCDNCMLQIFDQDCLFCSQMYLEEGKTFTCQTSCSSLFSNLSNSVSQTCTFMPQQNCDKNLNTGLDRFFQKLCACPKGQYLDLKKNKCQNCLSYCNSCKPGDANTCNKDDNQTYFGQCDLKAFNNGKQCVSNFMKMINHQNQQFQIDLSKIACLQTPTNEKDYSLQDNAFKLGHYSNSFFFSLNFNLNKEDFLSDKIYTICYLTNSDMHIFSLIVAVDKINKQIKLQFIDSSFSVLLNAHIEDKVDTWIGLYYDYLGFYLLVKYGYQQTSFYSQNIKNIIKQNLENPLLVVGVKSPLFPFSQNLCGSLGSNNWIISGDQSMRYFVNILFEFSEEDLELVLDFYFPNYQQNFQQNQLQIINKNDPSKTLTMYLTNPNVFNFDQFKGIKLDSNYGIIDLSQQLNKIPFVIKISITANNYKNCAITSYEFLKLISEQKNIIIFRIGAQYIDEQYFLEICTIENFIKVQQLNFSDMLAYIRCNIILNYIQDEIDIQIPQSLLTSPPKFYDIKLGNSTLLYNNPEIYYSQIQVYLGGFLFVNYENQDPCFVYINRKNMTCIYPKQGYALKDGNVVSQTNCNKNIKQNEPLYFYNKFTMTCQNSQIIIPNCINIDITNKKCNQCIDNQMILSKNCSCPDGMYQDQSSQLCQKCSIQCKTCSINKDNCLECKGNSQIPPLCECKIQNYYKDSNFNCQQCSVQCSSCTQNSDYCLTCSEGRINPPLCYCNPTLFLNTMSDPIENSCIRRSCPNKCQICNDNNQCVSCRGDRINPPYCLCSQGQYDDPVIDRQLCQSCNKGFYFNQILQKCESFQVQIPHQIYITANIQVQSSSNQYQIIIKFDFEVDLLDNIINQLKVNNLFELQISQVNSTLFDILKFSISQGNKQIALSINITQNILETVAFFRFKQTKVFLNKQFNYFLNPIYSQIPIQFNIGPYYLQTTMQTLLQNVNMNQIVVSLMNKFQVLFYILNSVQPTSLFILINIQMPPNFYSFLAKFSILVFREVPENQQDKIQYDFNLFGFDLDGQVQSTQNFFKRFGFTNSMIVNCQMIICKYAIICIVLYIVSALQIKINIQNLKTIIDFLIKRISIENEVNLLMIIISICIQFSQINQNEYLQRWGFYIGVIIGIIFAYSTCWFFIIYNSEKSEQYKNQLEIFYGRLKNQKNQFYLAKNIYFLFLFKKVLIVVSIYIYSDQPKIICIFACIMNILTAFLIIYLRPYKYLFTSIMKSIGDLLLSSTWILMTLIQNFNFKTQNNVVLDQSDVNYYLTLGYSASLTLTAFNGIYLIILILETVVMPIIEKINQKRQSQQLRQLNV